MSNHLYSGRSREGPRRPGLQKGEKPAGKQQKLGPPLAQGEYYTSK